jgi:polysaccharide pyruvyl transferase WcaK-like protein
MKIGILTQPLHDNYGGLLQAYALKEILEQFLHEVIIINRQSKTSRLRALASIVKSLVIGRPIKIDPKLKLTSAQKQILSRNTTLFRKKYIPNLSHLITKDREMLELNDMDFDAYVVGSDQCWRPLYSSKISNYFLDFAENEKNIKRIAYAASFGVSDWEFNEEDTKRCAELAKKFDAISVREDSGVELVKKHLRVNAVHLVDPTMLLPKEQYVKLTKSEKQTKSEGDLKIYVLDKTSEKQAFIDSIEEKLGLKQFEVLPEKRLGIDKVEDIEDFVFPNPAKWLRGFQDAKFVVTDSFHGTVFSILFKVPFIALGNKNRGMARFESLLKTFNLEDRLVLESSSFNVDNMVKNDINWDSVHAILEKEKEKALLFLKNI